MLSINGTMIILPNQSVSIEYKQTLCDISMKTRFIYHFVLSRFVEGALCIYVAVPLLLIITLFFHRRYTCINDFIERNFVDTYESENRFTYMIALMKLDIILIFVYTFIGVLYTWLKSLNTNDTLTYQNFLRWSIEGSLAPIIFLGFVPAHYFGIVDNFFEVYQKTCIGMFIIKVPLFIVMRYAESYSDFFLNNIRRLLVYSSCNPL